MLSLAVALVLVALSGCGGDDAAPEVGQLNPDQQSISALVGGVSDMSSELDRLRESFTKANAPTESHAQEVFGQYVRGRRRHRRHRGLGEFPGSITKYGTDTSVEKQWKAVERRRRLEIERNAVALAVDVALGGGR